MNFGPQGKITPCPPAPTEAAPPVKVRLSVLEEDLKRLTERVEALVSALHEIAAVIG